MTKLKAIILFALLSAGGLSCKKDFLDKTPDEDLTIQDVFSKRQYAESFLTGIYGNLPAEMNFANSWGNNPFVGAADEMEMPYTDVFSRFMNNGSWAPDNTMTEIWTNSFQAIRKSNVFLENVSKVPMAEPDRQQWIGEATFLRAFYHFLLMRVYGPVPIMDRTYQSDEDFKQIKRMPLSEGIKFIADECDKAAAMLRPNSEARDLGRVTSVAALALKARVMLYSASPLWNGNPDYQNFTDHDGTKLFPEFKADAWSVAANSAKAAITAAEASGYRLYRAADNNPVKSYQELFLVRNNSEILFARNMGVFDQFERTATPNGMGGWSGLAPTQEIVDAYQMADGQTPITGYNSDGSPIINAASGYIEDGYTPTASPLGYYPSDIRNMYVNREPRFYATVTYNEAIWRGRRIEFMILGRDGRKTGPDFTPTGYLLRKFSDPTVDVVQGKFTLKTWIFFRLGELYLNYAEALNEASGPVADVYKYVNAIRERSGLPNLEAGLSKEQMREKIRHERRIELAFETHRYFDTHRWKIAEITDNKIITGMNVEAGSYFQDNRYYTRTIIEKRVFEKKHYLWPIPQAEINKVPTLVQNPGW